MPASADDMIAALNAFNPDPGDAGTVHTLYTITEGFDALSETEKKRVIPHMFRVMERGWEADLGSPGPMVHAIETLGVPTYLALLTESVKSRPMYLNLWMVNRILNVTKDSAERATLLDLLRAVRDDPKWADVSEQADDFLKHQGESAAG
jgi:hypothetical protein